MSYATLARKEADRSAAKSSVSLSPRIGDANDTYEQEADRAAEAVVTDRQPLSWSLSKVNLGRVQRQAAPMGPESGASPEPNNYEEAGGKWAEAFFNTDVGKKIIEAAKQDRLVKGAEGFVDTLPGKIITGAAAVGAVSALAATHTALPVQIPEIPLDKIRPGLSVKITYEGPVDHPTKAMITFSYSPKGEEKKQTDWGRYRAETARIGGEQEKFRAGLKFTPGSAEDLQQKAEQKAIKDYPLRRFEAPAGTSDRGFAPNYAGLQGPQDSSARLRTFESPFKAKPFHTLDRQLELKPLAGSSSPAAEEKREEAPLIQRKVEKGTRYPQLPAAVGDVFRSRGKPLDVDTRQLMEAKMGFDFGKVRIHTDASAAASAQALDAAAYTVGSDVVFGAGRYAPRTEVGRKIIAHEMAHVIQQRSATRIDPNCISAPAETEAWNVAEAVITGRHAAVAPSQVIPRVQRIGPVATGQQAVGEGSVSPLEPRPYAIEMEWTPGRENTSALGFERNAEKFWKEYLEMWPEHLSADNQARITGKSFEAPKVDDVWIKYYPQDSAYSGSKLEHHHTGQSSRAVAIPKELHDAHTTFHPRTDIVGEPGKPLDASKALPPVPTRAETEKEKARHIKEKRIKGKNIWSPDIPAGSELMSVPKKELRPIDPAGETTIGGTKYPAERAVGETRYPPAKYTPPADVGGAGKQLLKAPTEAEELDWAKVHPGKEPSKVRKELRSLRKRGGKTIRLGRLTSEAKVPGPEVKTPVPEVKAPAPEVTTLTSEPKGETPASKAEVSPAPELSSVPADEVILNKPPPKPEPIPSESKPPTSEAATTALEGGTPSHEIEASTPEAKAPTPEVKTPTTEAKGVTPTPKSGVSPVGDPSGVPATTEKVHPAESPPRRSRVVGSKARAVAREVGHGALQIGIGFLFAYIREKGQQHIEEADKERIENDVAVALKHKKTEIDYLRLNNPESKVYARIKVTTSTTTQYPDPADEPALGRGPILSAPVSRLESVDISLTQQPPEESHERIGAPGFLRWFIRDFTTVNTISYSIEV